MNPLVQTQNGISSTSVERVLLSRANTDVDESGDLRLLTLSRLYKPIGDQKPAVSSESLEQLQHSFREYCRAAGIMSIYKELTTILTTTSPPVVSASVDTTMTYSAGDLCQVQVQSGKAEGSWIYGRIVSENDNTDVLNVFTFPTSSMPGAHTSVLSKHVRKCSVPSVEGLR
eukprot:COSAG02_NODE_32625_length_513_cov_0.867150_1_plen_171_part_11